MRSTVVAAGPPLLVQVDGRPGTAEDIAPPYLLPRGHLTSAQVRGGKLRGLDLHLARLTAAHSEMFGRALSGDLVRDRIAAAVAKHPDCYLRVNVDVRDDGEPRLVVVVRPPLEAPTAPQSLTCVDFVRGRAHLKHTGTYGQTRHGDAAVRGGFDDALLIAPDRQVTETSVANIGFVRDGALRWPSAPALRGITWQLLDAALPARRGTLSALRVQRDEVHSFDGAFLANSLGVVAVGLVDGRACGPAAASAFVVEAYAALRWDAV